MWVGWMWRGWWRVYGVLVVSFLRFALVLNTDLRVLYCACMSACLHTGASASTSRRCCAARTRRRVCCSNSGTRTTSGYGEGTPGADEEHEQKSVLF